MMNVLHLCESSSTGGAESVLVSLAQGLERSRYRSVVCLLSEGWLKTELDRRGIETLVIPQPRSLDVPWLLRVRRLLRARRIDVMHSHEFATNVYASFLCALTGVPAIATTHGKNHYPDRWRRRAAYRFAARHATMVAVSEDLKAFMAREVGIAPARIRVVRNGIDLGRYALRAGGGGMRAALGIGAHERVVGTVGNLFAVKGQAFLLRACRTVADAFPDLVVLLAGEGEELAALEREAAALGLSRRVRFLGFRDDVPALLQAMEVFALPSLSEGLPLSVLEALALERPVVATSVGGIPEIVEDGVTGYLVPPRDPQALAERILRLLRDPALAASMGRQGRRRVEEAFSLGQMIRQYQSLYDAAVRA